MNELNSERSKIDYNYTRFVGYQENCDTTNLFFRKQTVKIISDKLTELLIGVAPRNRPIVVTDNVIESVMTQVYNNFRPEIGDIFTRYVILQTPNDDLQSLIDQTIQIIYDTIKTEYGIAHNNEQLSVWNTLYGDFNEHSLRQHAPIKVRVKRSQPMQFHMNY